MTFSATRIGGMTMLVGALALLAACGSGGGGRSTATPAASVAPATATAGASSVASPTAAAAAGTPASAATGTPGVTAAPCASRTSLEGAPLVPGVSFSLNPSTRWQICNGGAAAGSSEKYLFRSTDGGDTWTLISQTTLGAPTPQAGVGAMPNGNGVTALFFQDASKGWLGLSSPGANFYRSQDGGVNWTEVAGVVPPAVPVRSISFSSATDGAVTTAAGTWTTTDGGTTWTKAP
ncbi:MAG: hypothetical protein IVW36_05130 [Dehalococcoidia bacterium]|nr:hypothetical protein [Dehalococcoidia bacterium]